MSNQRNGDQREALFIAIAAISITCLPCRRRWKDRQKHTSVQIKPEQYNIVGSHSGDPR